MAGYFNSTGTKFHHMIVESGANPGR